MKYCTLKILDILIFVGVKMKTYFFPKYRGGQSVGERPFDQRHLRHLLNYSNHIFLLVKLDLL